MEIKTQVTTNELGETVIQLSKEDWENYGKQAGYMPEVVKEASADEIEVEVEEAETTEEAVEEPANVEASLNGGIGNQITIREDSAFNEENYPNLVAEQEKDGLIGPFAPRP